jgi:hypothetical protein
MLDLDAQEDDVSGAAQNRTAEFAAPKVHPLCTAEPSEQD